MGRRLSFSGGIGLCIRIELFQSLFQLSHGLEQFGQFGKGADGAQPLMGRERRGAGDAGSGRDVAPEAALSIDDRTFVDGEVARGTGLPGEQDIALQGGAAGQAGLRADDIVFADYASMADLHQTVDLGAALYKCFSDRGAVDAGEALDFDVIFDDRDTGLDDLVMRAISALGETEAVAAHHNTI